MNRIPNERQHGFSLVELLVASTIGLFLVAILATIFSSMRQTSVAREGLSKLQDNERLAMTFLSNAIQGAGYQPNPVSTTAAVAFPAYAPSAGGTYVAGQSVTGNGGGTGYGLSAPLGADDISLRFIASTPSPIQGCTGTLVSGTLYHEYFHVGGVAPNTYLACSENSSADIALVPGVRGMAILYGVDTTGSGSVTTYQAASAVTSWTAVKTVSITLQFTNPLYGQPSQPAIVSFTKTIPYMNGL